MWIWIHNLTTQFFPFFSFRNGADGQCTGDNTIASYGDLPDLYWYMVGITILSRGSPLDVGAPTTSVAAATPFLDYQLVLKVPIGIAQSNIHSVNTGVNSVNYVNSVNSVNTIFTIV